MSWFLQVDLAIVIILCLLLDTFWLILTIEVSEHAIAELIGLHLARDPWCSANSSSHVGSSTWFGASGWTSRALVDVTHTLSLHVVASTPSSIIMVGRGGGSLSLLVTCTSLTKECLMLLVLIISEGLRLTSLHISLVDIINFVAAVILIDSSDSLTVNCSVT